MEISRKVMPPKPGQVVLEPAKAQPVARRRRECGKSLLMGLLLPGCGSSTKTFPTASDRSPTQTSFTKTSLNGSNKNRNAITLTKSWMVLDQLDPECQNSFTGPSLSPPSLLPTHPPHPFLHPVL